MKLGYVAVTAAYRPSKVTLGGCRKLEWGEDEHGHK
jgi:hypothetical protein